MGAVTEIGWTDHTFNPWVGCTKVSPACDNCYAEGWAKRTGQGSLWQGERRRTSASNWRQPLKWDRDAKAAGARRRVFCASLADVFDNQVPEEWRQELVGLIAMTPNLDWLLLTKRPQNVTKMVQDLPWNVWLGTTVENQEEADRRIPHLVAAPARIRFLSCEPLLGELDLRAYFNRLDWVICGGESGPGHRAMAPVWARSLRNQCALFDVPFFFKQWGGRTPKAGGNELDGKKHEEFPT